MFNKYSHLVSRICHSPGMPVCSDQNLPETDFDFCTPNIRLSEITTIYIARVGAAPFTDWTDPEEWCARLSQTDMGINFIRTLTVIADKPTPNSIRQAISNARKVVTKKEHKIFATIDEVSEANHNFVSYLGTGKRFRVWYKTAGDYLFGGNSGIIVTISGDMVLARGEGEIMTYQLELSWNSLRTEDFIINPIVDCVAADPVEPGDDPLILWTSPIRAGTSTRYGIRTFAMLMGMSAFARPTSVFASLGEENAWIAASNIVAAGAGLTGVFDVVGNDIVYNQGPGETWNVSTPVLVLQKWAKIELQRTSSSGAPADFNFTYGNHSVGGGGIDFIMDWGDASAPDYVASSDALSHVITHTYADALADKEVYLYHNHLHWGIIAFQAPVSPYFVYEITNELPSSCDNFASIGHAYKASTDLTVLQPLHYLGGYIQIQSSIIDTFAPALFATPFNSLTMLHLQLNKLKSAQVDQILNGIYANTTFGNLTFIGLNGQTPAAPPTGASAVARAAIIAAGITLVTD